MSAEHAALPHHQSPKHMLVQIIVDDVEKLIALACPAHSCTKTITENQVDLKLHYQVLTDTEVSEKLFFLSDSIQPNLIGE